MYSIIKKHYHILQYFVNPECLRWVVFFDASVRRTFLGFLDFRGSIVFWSQLDFVGSIHLRKAVARILALPSGSRPPPRGDKGGAP